jgi:hypothetical protein
VTGRCRAPCWSHERIEENPHGCLYGGWCGDFLFSEFGPALGATSRGFSIHWMPSAFLRLISPWRKRSGCKHWCDESCPFVEIPRGRVLEVRADQPEHFRNMLVDLAGLNRGVIVQNRTPCATCGIQMAYC